MTGVFIRSEVHASHLRLIEKYDAIAAAKCVLKAPIVEPIWRRTVYDKSSVRHHALNRICLYLLLSQ